MLALLIWESIYLMCTHSDWVSLFPLSKSNHLSHLLVSHLPLFFILSIVESSGESKMKSCNVMINVTFLGAHSDIEAANLVWYVV